jgi:hypothetical protein
MIKTTCCLALTLVLVPIPTWAQGSVTIFGTVADASGSIVPGVTVTATNTQTALTRAVVSDANGTYTIGQLPPGVYTVKAELSGFKIFLLERVQTQVDENRRVNIVMELGQLAESVTVTGERAQVDTRSGTLREVVDSLRIVELPLNGRNPLQLQLLVAGAGGRAGQGQAGRDCECARRPIPIACRRRPTREPDLATSSSCSPTTTATIHWAS